MYRRNEWVPHLLSSDIQFSFNANGPDSSIPLHHGCNAPPTTCQLPLPPLAHLAPPFTAPSPNLHLASMSPRLSLRYFSCSCHSLFAAFMTHCRPVAPLSHLLFSLFLSDADMFVNPRGIKPRRGQMVSHWVHGGRC